MAWEWHNRRRGKRGQFVPPSTCEGVEAQLHVRCTEGQLAKIRARALVLHKSMSEYVLDLVRAEMLAAKYPEADKPGVPLDADEDAPEKAAAGQ